MTVQAVGVLLAAAVVLSPLAVAVVRRPQRGVLALAALVPFDGLLLIAPLPPVLSAWKEAAVVALVLAAVVAPKDARSDRPTELPGWVVPAGLLVLLSVISAAVTAGPVSAWGLKVSLFYMLLPLVLWRCPLTAADRDRLVTILMCTGAVCAVFGVAQQILGHEQLRAWGYPYNETIRFSGDLLRSFSTFNQPFPFGLYLCLVLLVGLPVALREATRPRNMAFLALSPVLVAGLASSVVRGAMLGLLVGGILICLRRHRGLVHLAAPGMLAVLLIPPAVLATFASSSSLGVRATGWGEILDRAAAAPFGHGIGTTAAAAERALAGGASPGDVLIVDGAAYQPDNQYVKALLELGPLGLWLLLLVYAAALAQAFGIARTASPPDRALAEGVAASLVAVVAASWVSTYLEIFPLDLYFWLLLGVVTSMVRGPVRGLEPPIPVSDSPVHLGLR
jgi:hypothetical protein